MKTNIINTPVKDFSPVNIEERKKLGIKSGDTVKVWVKIKEKNNKGVEKIRLQAFEGLVLSTKHGTEPGATFTVRKVSKGVGIERIFPLYSPMIDKIEIVKKGGTRKSKLYYIRDKVAKQIKRQMRRATLVNIATTSDIEETERRIREAEEAKKAQEEAEKKAQEEEAQKKAEEAKKAEEETKKENSEGQENTENKEEAKEVKKEETEAEKEEKKE